MEITKVSELCFTFDSLQCILSSLNKIIEGIRAIKKHEKAVLIGTNADSHYGWSIMYTQHVCNHARELFVNYGLMLPKYCEGMTEKYPRRCHIVISTNKGLRRIRDLLVKIRDNQIILDTYKNIRKKKGAQIEGTAPMRTLRHEREHWASELLNEYHIVFIEQRGTPAWKEVGLRWSDNYACVRRDDD